MTAAPQVHTSVDADGFGHLDLYRDEIDRITIGRADPRIRLSCRMVSGFILTRPSWATVDTSPGGVVVGFDGCQSLDGMVVAHRADGPVVLTLRDSSGRKVIYRIDPDTCDHSPVGCSVVAEWPD